MWGSPGSHVWRMWKGAVPSLEWTRMPLVHGGPVCMKSPMTTEHTDGSGSRGHTHDYWQRQYWQRQHKAPHNHHPLIYFQCKNAASQKVMLPICLHLFILSRTSPWSTAFIALWFSILYIRGGSQLSHVQSIETSELKWIDFNESTLVYDLAGYHSKKIPQCQKLPNPFFAKSIAFVSGQL